jgi:hypothetical protein
MSNARENVNLLTSADWDIATLRLANWGAGAVPPQVVLKTNYVAGDGGGLFRYDANDTTTADNGGIVIVDAAGNRWKRQYEGNDIYAIWFGVIADDATDNTTALQAAFNAAANKTLVLPRGTFRSGRIIGTAPLTVVGVSADETIWKRKADSNLIGLRFTSINGVVLKRFKYDANIAQNTGSGSHSGIDFVTCSNQIIEDVTVVDCRGTFLGAAVGTGIGMGGGTGSSLTRVYAFNCYDGILFFNQHNFFRTYGCRVVSNVRNGLLIDNCKDWVDSDTFAVLNGTDVTLDAGCSNILVQNTDNWVSNNAYCDSSTYGYGLQAQINCDNFQINNCRAFSNAWDGIGITGAGITANTKGRVVGGVGIANRLSNLAVNDDSQNLSVVGFVDGGGSIEGINVFRSTAHIIGCQGNITVWEAATINGVSIGAAGSGYTDGTYTNVPLVGPTWYTDGTGRSALTVNVTVSGGAVTAVAINFQGWLALPPTSLTGLTAPSLPGGAGAQFTITLLGGSSNTCQGTTITNGNNGGTLRVQSGAITSLPVFNCGFTTISDPGATLLTAGTAGLSIQNLSAASIAAIANAINTTNKITGKMVYDNTNNRIMIASGANANSPWYVADGGASVTPS